MPDIRLLDFVLLGCDFEVWPARVGTNEHDRGPEVEADTEEREVDELEGEPQDAPPAEATEGNAHDGDVDAMLYPEGNFLRMEPTSWEYQDNYLLSVEASIDDPAIPFRLYLTVGSRFFVGREEDGSRPSLEETESTLVWLTYPYLRETISAISGRSPLPPYILPAITKLPHPSVTDEE